MAAEAQATAGMRADALQFLRFCLVGGAGFCVDAAILTGLIGPMGFDPIAARLLSFAVAVFVTFELNRRWAFRRTAPARYWRRLGAYVGLQGLGFLCNFAVYTLMVLGLRSPLNRPLFCLAVASALALVVNFAGARMVVFRRGGV